MNLVKWRTSQNSNIAEKYEPLPGDSQLPGPTTRARLVLKKTRLKSMMSVLAAVVVLWTLAYTTFTANYNRFYCQRSPTSPNSKPSGQSTATYGPGLWTSPTPAQHQPPSAILTEDNVDPGPSAASGDPPRYKKYHEQERNLPQHNMSLPYPDGSHAKFLWVHSHGWSRFGWGDYMQEMILNTYLAYAAQRAYVFDSYTLEREGPEVGSWNGRPTPARIPLSAFISGPIVGGLMRDKDIPRAVSREYYYSACPESERVIFDARKIQDRLDSDATVNQIVDRWVAELRSIQSPCVELARSSPTLFGYEITTSKRVLDLFPALSKSPILSGFGWSPLVLEGFYDNFKHFASSWDFDDAPLLRETWTTPLRGLLVLHIRHGGNETSESCRDAYLNSVSFMGFNSFPGLPDKYSPPKVDQSHSMSEITRKHCLPSIPEVVQKVLGVNAPHINRVYVMTNAPRPWLEELKAALRTVHDWANGIATSHDLKFSSEGRFVAEALDMHVAQRAERFIGNGFSSFTSDVVMLRMHNQDLRPSDTHFW
ncbi:hypothetical protein MVEN_02236400 [Mycena venus]|uniref:Uncharacterized protein n=1 Tax=Mycena venus TaxID=2733690 RepID=A0A8H6X7T5_9AGAR|nr:hypothetical protein MVEN_02236400 [Mycena venus]